MQPIGRTWCRGVVSLAVILAACGAAVAQGVSAAPASSSGRPQTVLFLCPHGAAKSVLASAYFRRAAAERGLAVVVQSAGTEPDPAVAPAVAARLEQQGLAVPAGAPRRATAAELAAADVVISLGCDLSGYRTPARLERWDDVPSPSASFDAADAAIRAHVDAFVDALATAAAKDRPAVDRLGREILQELIETNTTASTGDTTLAAAKVAARLLAAGFPRADVVEASNGPRKGNLVARLRGRGTGGKPVLFFAHLDVVEARREDWSVDPFVLTERDGYFYGRGTLDVKGGAATLVAAFCDLRQRGYVPDRDLILALTADEEVGPEDNGVDWLLKNRRALIDAEYAINVDAGGPELHGGNVTALDVQAAEKVFHSFTLTVHNPGGHSSLPGKENAIYRLAAALQHLSALELPARTNDITRAWFAGMAKLTPGAAADLQAVAAPVPDAGALERLSAASPFYNAMLRTTCVPTLLEGGHAENALPQMAKATVNCRVLPDEKPEAVQDAIVHAIADPQVEVVAVRPPILSPPSPLAPDVLTAIRSAAAATWGAVPILPMMETGATDGLYLRNAGMPVYGVVGIAFDPDDVRSHGRDERILVRSFYEGIRFVEALAAAIGGGAPIGGSATGITPAR